MEGRINRRLNFCTVVECQPQRRMPGEKATKDLQGRLHNDEKWVFRQGESARAKFPLCGYNFMGEVAREPISGVDIRKGVTAPVKRGPSVTVVTAIWVLRDYLGFPEGCLADLGAIVLGAPPQIFWAHKARGTPSTKPSP